MPEDAATHPILSQIDRDELVELGKDLIRIPSKIGEETPVCPLDRRVHEVPRP